MPSNVLTILAKQSSWNNVARRLLTTQAITNRRLHNTSVPKHRRVVVTGLGLVCPLGRGHEESWTNLVAGQSGVTRVKDEQAFENIPCKIAAYVPQIDSHLEKSFSRSQLRTLSRSTLYTLLAAREAFQDAGCRPGQDDVTAERCGVAIGSGMIDFDEVINAHKTFTQEGYGRVSPHFLTRVLLNLPAGYVSIEFGLKGPNHTVSTACTTGAHAIGDAFNFIRHNTADLMICGGVEASINPLAFVSFCRIRALATKFNETPHLASRPFDRDRNGFVMGEGASLFILEELEHARRRGASIYGEVLGYGLSGDANHITAPSEDGYGAQCCIRNALADAQLSVDQIEHVNCHATSTPIGDQIELKAIKSVFGDADLEKLALTSTKSSTGHLLGAAGSIEAMFALLACHSGVIPATLNLDNPIQTSLNIVTKQAREWKSQRRIAITNSFGFGGTNACLVLGNFIDP